MMDKEDLNYLVNLLRSEEYDETDIMRAWIAIETLQEQKEDLIRAVNNFLSDKYDIEYEEDLWSVLAKIGR